MIQIVRVKKNSISTSVVVNLCNESVYEDEVYSLFFLRAINENLQNLFVLRLEKRVRRKELKVKFKKIITYQQNILSQRMIR